MQVGYDKDEHCIAASYSNAELNGRKASCSFYVCSPDGSDLGANSSSFDICMANIFQGDLIALRPTLCELVKPGGTIVMSGILSGAQVLGNCTAPCGFCSCNMWIRLNKVNTLCSTIAGYERSSLRCTSGYEVDQHNNFFLQASAVVQAYQPYCVTVISHDVEGWAVVEAIRSTDSGCW